MSHQVSDNIPVGEGKLATDCENMSMTCTSDLPDKLDTLGTVPFLVLLVIQGASTRRSSFSLLDSSAVECIYWPSGLWTSQCQRHEDP